MRERENKGNLANFFQSFIVVHKEPHVLKANVHVTVGAILSMLLDRLTAAAERVLVDLVLDLFRRVGQEDGRVGIGRAHLGLGTLQSRKEHRMDECRLGQTESRCHVSSHAKVRILLLFEISLD